MEKLARRQAFVCRVRIQRAGELPTPFPVRRNTSSAAASPTPTLVFQSSISHSNRFPATGRREQHGHKSKVSREPLTGDVSLVALKCKGGEGCVYMMTLCLSIKRRLRSEAVELWRVDDGALGGARVAAPSAGDGGKPSTCRHIFVPHGKQKKTQPLGGALCGDPAWPRFNPTAVG